MKSKSLPARVAIIELDSSHDECLLTQINALKNTDCWVLLVTNSVIKKRNQHLESLVDEWIDIDPRSSHTNRNGLTGSAIGDALIVRRLMRTLKKKRIEKAVFNTAQGGHVRNACLFSLFRKIEFIGIVHTARKFHGSFTQRIINLKIKKYFVLGEFLVSISVGREKAHQDRGAGDSLTSTQLSQRSFSQEKSERNQKFKVIERSRKHRQLASFYPIDFPKVDAVNFVEDDTTHISLIGSVELRRKDLIGFVSLIAQCDANTHFHFLGKANSDNLDVIELKKKLAQIDRLEQVTFYDFFVPFEIIDLNLRKSSAILPLIHPETPSADEYFRHQIPGAMNLALGYKIPLLLHEEYRKIEELSAASVYYTLDSFSSSLGVLTAREERIKQIMHSTEKYTSEHQYKTIINFLFNHENR